MRDSPDDIETDDIETDPFLNLTHLAVAIPPDGAAAVDACVGQGRHRTDAE